MRVALLGLIAACGSAAPVAKPVVAKVEKVPPRLEPNCADMGPLLRRVFAPDGAEDTILDDIATECRDMGWSAEVMECVASTPEPNANDCMIKLTGAQTESLNAKVATYTSWPETEDLYPELQCADVLKATDVAEWNPPVPESEGDLARALRRPAMLALCDEEWDQATLTCVGDAMDPAGLAACEGTMEPALKKKLAEAVASADAAQKKMTTVMGRSAAGYSCEKAVAAHYGAAKWKGQAPTLVGGSRAKVIEASKKLMRDACNAESWAAEVRACVVAVDEPVCWKLGKVGSDEVTWAYPAEGTVPVATGVKECDEWGAAVSRVVGCAAVAEDLRASLRGSFGTAKGAFKDLFRLPKETLRESLPAIAESCGQARDAVAQVAQKAGC